jgi:hypothetical protein
MQITLSLTSRNLAFRWPPDAKKKNAQNQRMGNANADDMIIDISKYLISHINIMFYKFTLFNNTVVLTAEGRLRSEP